MRFSHALICLTAIVVWLLTAVLPARADIGVGESVVADNLNHTGVFEVNPDSAGLVYVSDSVANQVISIDRTTGAYVRYRPASTTFAFGDAKTDASGAIWGSNFYSRIGRVTTGATPQLTYWNLPVGIGGFVFDATGKLWLSPRAGVNLTSFDPTNGSYCQYNVGGTGAYISEHGGRLWLADSVNGRILRFDPSTFQLTAWTLPVIDPENPPFPVGLAFDADEALWWADATLGQLGRLWPASAQAMTFDLRADSVPELLAAGEGVIWYADQHFKNGSVGFLDPARAVGVSHLLSVATTTPTPSCGTRTPQGPFAITRTSGTFTFPTINWPLAADAPSGTTVYRPADATPRGITTSGGRIWVADGSRAVLSRTPHLPKAPVISISRSQPGISLAWQPVNLDEGNAPTVVARYEVWRSSRPYFRPGDASVPLLLGEPPAGPFPDTEEPAPGGAHYYVLKSVGENGLLSGLSNRTGVFSFTLTRGGP